MEIEKEPYKIGVFGVAGREKSTFLNHMAPKPRLLSMIPLVHSMDMPLEEWFDILKEKILILFIL